MMDSRENAQTIVDLFNEFYETDPDAATLLVGLRFSCNDAVAEHPRFLAAGEPGKPSIGIVGLLNAMFSESHRIGICIDDDQIITGFALVDVSPKGKDQR